MIFDMPKNSGGAASNAATWSTLPLELNAAFRASPMEPWAAG
jgi:hypothetical protein